MKIGLFFGSFNPVHMGHMAIANFMVEFTDIDKVWFVISPQNPFKAEKELLAHYHRYAILDRAVEHDTRFKVSNIEFGLPKPSYTINTLMVLTEKYPDMEFVIIMGSDGLEDFIKWKDRYVIEDKFTRYVYPRPGFEKVNSSEHKNIRLVDAPMIDVSSTFIRDSMAKGHDVRHFMPLPAFEYIEEMNFYKKKKEKSANQKFFFKL